MEMSRPNARRLQSLGGFVDVDTFWERPGTIDQAIAWALWYTRPGTGRSWDRALELAILPGAVKMEDGDE